MALLLDADGVDPAGRLGILLAADTNIIYNQTNTVHQKYIITATVLLLACVVASCSWLVWLVHSLLYHGAVDAWDVVWLFLCSREGVVLGL